MAADDEYGHFSAAMLLKQCYIYSDTKKFFKRNLLSPFSSPFRILVTSTSDKLSLNLLTNAKVTSFQIHLPRIY